MVSNEALQRKIAILRSARTDRIGHDEDLFTCAAQIQSGLHDADVGFGAAQNHLGLFVPREPREASFLHGGEVHLFSDGGFRNQVSQCGHRLSEPLGVVLGQQYGNA